MNRPFVAAIPRLQPYSLVALFGSLLAACNGCTSHGRPLPPVGSERVPPPPIATGAGAVTQVAVADQQSCVLRKDGRVACWGRNLLDGSPQGREPQLVPRLEQITVIAGGASHLCALDQAGSVWCWGENRHQELGAGEGTSPGPEQARGLSDVRRICAGGRFSCALRKDGRVACWGINDQGQLGDGTRQDRGEPMLSEGIADAVDVSCGEYHACALTRDGHVACWGERGSGAFSELHVDPITAARTVPGLANIKEVRAGFTHTCARDADSAVWCWGSNADGALGAGSELRHADEPLRVASLDGATALVTTLRSSCGLMAGGKIHCVGGGKPGAQFELSDMSPSVGFAYRYEHGCSLQESGQVVCRGINYQAQLGVPSGAMRRRPVRSAEATVIDFDAFGALSCLVRDSGVAECWGNLYPPGDGGGGITGPIIPNQPAPLGVSDARSVAVGGQHICVMQRSGGVACLGHNDHSQLGRVGSWSRSAVAVDGVSGAVALAAGEEHNCALLASGAVQCWGRGNEGELGDGGDADGTVRTVSGLSDAQQISAGARHNCAVRKSGEVMCWGDNSSRQLGDGTNENRKQPVLVPGIREAVAVRSGRFSSCALLKSGSLVCWGNRVARTTVDSVHFTAFDTASSHSCGIDESQGLWCWGNNSSGQLGDGTSTQRLTPVKVAGARAKRVGLGDEHSCFIDTNDELWCFGKNRGSQLRNNDPGEPGEPTMSSNAAIPVALPP